MEHDLHPHIADGSLTKTEKLYLKLIASHQKVLVGARLLPLRHETKQVLRVKCFSNEIQYVGTNRQWQSTKMVPPEPESFLRAENKFPARRT
ncbi:MAG: hypothetical protein QG600_621 [Patescibacteria group bacterium]|nr:hypothetical protein [Patescibacteria group bacterium]